MKTMLGLEKTEKEILAFEVSDEALEIAAGGKGKSGLHARCLHRLVRVRRLTSLRLVLGFQNKFLTRGTESLARGAECIRRLAAFCSFSSGVSQYCFALSEWNSLFGASRHILHCRRERKAPSIGAKISRPYCALRGALDESSVLAYLCACHGCRAAAPLT